MAVAEEWAGRVGAEWARQADGLDGLLGPMGDLAFAALGDVSGKAVLDLGCGAGATTLALAEGGANVVGIDISPDLIARAKARGQAAQSTARFVLGDAGAFDHKVQFDALFSRFGAMFFDAPLAAFTHLRAQMKPGAEMHLVAWTEPRENIWAALPLQVGRELLGDRIGASSPPGTPGPFAWSDSASFAPILAEAGWRDLAFEAVTRDVLLRAGDSDDPLDQAVTFCMRIGPLASRLRNIAAPERADLPDILRATLEPYLRDGGVWVPGKTWRISAVS